MAKTKKNKIIGKDFLKKMRGRPENHILKKTNREIEKLMGRISYIANYTQLIMAYQINASKTKKLSVEQHKKMDKEINMMIEEVQRLSLLAHIKNQTIETKMIKKYDYEKEPSCQ